jgi:hypothetical protein
MSSLRPLNLHFAPEPSEKSVEALQGEIGALCSERQRLREASAEQADLERNRLEIARLQWQLSHALIERHGRHDAAA